MTSKGKFNFQNNNFLNKLFNVGQTRQRNGSRAITIENALLWDILANEYVLENLQDWSSSEGYWFKTNPLLRVTQCNENHIMCKSLPVSFITVRNYLSDLTLIHTISPHTSGNRVPVVSYCCSSSKVGSTLLLRCSSFKMDVTNILYDAIRPLNIVEVGTILLPLTKLESAYNKLRKSCSLDAAIYPHFLSHTGKWLRIVSKVLCTVKEMVYTLKEESSLLLIEEDDNNFNPILTSLIQVILDPKRRTIVGFESLLSKEWIYLNGLSPVARSPNIMLFTLFLDSVWQLLCQNPRHFEFSSLYLIRLYDLQTIPASSEDVNQVCYISNSVNENSSQKSAKWFVSNNHTPSSKSHNCKQENIPVAIHLHPRSNHSRDTNSNLPKSLFNLDMVQLMFLHNPFYQEISQLKFLSNPSNTMKIIYDLFLLDLWRPLYLRWVLIENHRNYFNCFSPTEFIYFDFLLNKIDHCTDHKLFSTLEQDIIESYL